MSLKTIYHTTFLEDRRKALKLGPTEVAKAVGIGISQYLWLERHGRLPEHHFKRLYKILDCTLLDLYIELHAATISCTFCVPIEECRQFIRKRMATRESRHNQGTLGTMLPPLNESDPEFAGLPESHKNVIRHVRSLTPEEGFRSMVESGIYFPDGTLTPEYGGTLP